METGNKFILLLVLSISSHFLYTEGGPACAPSSFRYIEPFSKESVTPTKQPTLPPTPPTPKSTPTPTPKQEQKPAPKAPKQEQEPAPKIPNLEQELLQVKLPNVEVSSVASGIPKPHEFVVPDAGVKKACDSTDNPLLCVSSVKPYLSDKIDVATILESEIKAAQAQTQQVIEKAMKIAQDPSTPPDVAEGLNACKDSYDSVISNLDEAIDAMATRDVGKMNSMLSAVFSDVSTCQDSFSESTTSPSPMADLEGPIKDLAGNCLALVSGLNWH